MRTRQFCHATIAWSMMQGTQQSTKEIKMNEAQRDTQGKLNFLATLLDLFPNALDLLQQARDYGVEHYTQEEAGIDGATNWMDSINSAKHESFKQSCREGTFRHLMKIKWEGEKDHKQDNVPHMAYVALNAFMYLEYLASEPKKERSLVPIPVDKSGGSMLYKKRDGMYEEGK